MKVNKDIILTGEELEKILIKYVKEQTGEEVDAFSWELNRLEFSTNFSVRLKEPHEIRLLTIKLK